MNTQHCEQSQPIDRSKLIFSRFNILIQDDGRWYLVNSLTGAIFEVDDTKTLQGLQQKDPSAFDDDLIEELIKKGVLIRNASKDCELNIVRYFNNLQKFNQSSLSVTLLLTMNCNLRCVYCYEGAGIVSQKSINAQGYERVYNFLTRELTQRGCRSFSLCLFGGEPTLELTHAESFLEKIDKFCNENKIRFTTSIITNGTMITPKIIDILQRYHCTYEQITLDGTRPIHDQRRIGIKGEGSFDKTLDGIRKLAQSSLPKPSIRINVDKENYESIEPLLDLLIQEGLSCCHVNFGIVKGNTPSCASYCSHCFSDEETGDLLEKLWALAEKKHMGGTPSPSHNFLFCGMGSDSAFTIAPDLKLYKCWDFVNMPEHQVAELNEEGYMTSLKPAFYRWMTRDPLDIPQCAECAYLPSCGGGCVAMADADEAHYRNPGCFKMKGVYEKKILALIREKAEHRQPQKVS